MFDRLTASIRRNPAIPRNGAIIRNHHLSHGSPDRVLVWQWSRFGGPPRFAVQLAAGLEALPGTKVCLSLSTNAEIMRGLTPPRCDLPVATYNSAIGLAFRAVLAPFHVAGLARRIAALGPNFAICAQAGPLDLLMAAALRHLRIPYIVLVHDADHHPGDGLPLQMILQRLLCRRALTIAALSTHVGNRLIEQGLAGTPGRPLIQLTHPPLHYPSQSRPSRPDGTFRLLAFGRLLRYKGLDLLADALTALGPRPGLEVRVVGSGPEGTELNALRALPGVSVENRWVPEDEVGSLFTWADAVILPYREASQSGVASVALSAACRIIATRIGGLAEQLANEPSAILCDPDGASLADGIRQWLAAPDPPHAAPPPDQDPWAGMAASLLDQVAALPGIKDHFA